MTPQAFIAKWLNSPIKERAAAQEHFLDLCRMLDEPTPAQGDQTGLDYGFEVGATKTTGGRGFADVFKRGFFAWEYKGTKANLDTAFAQLQRYAVALDNPPLLIVSDIGSLIRIHTNWTNSVSKVYEIPITELGDLEKRNWLKAAFRDPELLKPSRTRQELTEEVAGEFARLARSLRERGNTPELVAHFINRLVFCMFAEDVKLLPQGIFSRMLDRAIEEPAEFEVFAGDLFASMKSGGRIGFERIAWFNGGLFDDDLVISLTKGEIQIVRNAAVQYWGDIDPSILGTLFERGLDPDKRSQLGAHYTDREKIMMIINPVVVEPLAAEWEAAKTEISALMDRASASKGGAKTRATKQAQAVLDRYLTRLGAFRVLDPACGSGNFLYLALRALKDLEHRAQVEAEALGLPRTFPRIGPEVVKGIEINPYAAELARVSVWIGEIQWMLTNGFAASQNPILKPLDNIECRNALMNWTPDDDGEGGCWEEAAWPDADAIVGNPPFLGGKALRSSLGDETVNELFRLFTGRVGHEADLVAYWFEKAREKLSNSATETVGFVSTNSIRAGANRRTIDRILTEHDIVDAWSDEPWAVEGAAVRVSLIAFAKRGDSAIRRLNGIPVERIHADLTSSAIDFASAQPLRTNSGCCFQGPVKVGAFDVEGELARLWLVAPLNPNGRPNADVLRPWANGMDVARRPSGKWIIDFANRSQAEAALYEAPFEYAKLHVMPARLKNRDPQRRRNWWRLGRSGDELKSAASKLSRIIISPRVAKYRLFVWAPSALLPDSRLVGITRDDDTAFGLLHSKFHELWSLRLGGWHGVGNDPQYTPRTSFETFPFPEGMTPDIPAADYAQDPRAIKIAAAARQLNEMRENWLNPANLVMREAEVVPGFPDRLIPIDARAEKELKDRTLTNLYNERPSWLNIAHEALDEAVAEAYGWPIGLSEDEILTRLFVLNQERARQ